MHTREEMKSKAKANFKRNYWPAVLASLVVLLTDTIYLFTDNASYSFNGTDITEDIQILQIPTAVAFIAGVLLLRPLLVGGKKFYLENREKNARVNLIVMAFKTDYWNIVWTMLLRTIFTFLWCLLLVVPGLIKMYAYRMVPYILAENPHIYAHDALKMSEDMMKDNKGRLFMLDLSFIGWLLLELITGGIVGIFYANPYMDSTYTEFYLAVKEEKGIDPATAPIAV